MNLANRVVDLSLLNISGTKMDEDDIDVDILDGLQDASAESLGSGEDGNLLIDQQEHPITLSNQKQQQQKYNNH